MTRHAIELYGGLAAMGIGALFLVTILGGLAIGLGVRMFEVASGHAQFARKSKRRPAHRPRYASDGERVPLAELLSQPVLPDDTSPIERIDHG